MFRKGGLGIMIAAFILPSKDSNGFLEGVHHQKRDVSSPV
jgi:hypothetical protein